MLRDPFELAFSFPTLLAIYLFFGYCLVTIAKKTNTNNSWMGWIPVLNLYLIFKIARKPGWWMIIYFIPIFGSIAYILSWMEISRQRGKSPWFGLLMIEPLLGISLGLLVSEFFPGIGLISLSFFLIVPFFVLTMLAFSK